MPPGRLCDCLARADPLARNRLSGRDGAGGVSAEHPVAPIRYDIIEGIPNFPGYQVSDQAHPPEPAQVADDPQHGRGPSGGRRAFNQDHRIDPGELRVADEAGLGRWPRERSESK